MVDRYWRKIKDVENNIENSMQISNILLKLKEYDEKLGDLSNIENNISSNLGIINTNKSDISSNLKKINNIENDITIKIKKDIYKKTFIIPNMSTNYNSKNIADIYFISNLTTDGIIRIDANYNYSYDKTNNFSHVYKFYNNRQKFKEVRLNHNNVSNVVNDKFDIQGVNSTRINLLIYLINNNKDNTSVELFDYNTVQVIYKDNIDILKSDTNKSNISSNLGKIDPNKNSIEDNDADIAYNLREINKIKNTKTYLKNIYNILFYDKKTQIDFRNLFFLNYLKLMQKNDFIEMYYKIKSIYNMKIYLKLIM